MNAWVLHIESRWNKVHTCNSKVITYWSSISHHVFHMRSQHIDFTDFKYMCSLSVVYLLIVTVDSLSILHTIPCCLKIPSSSLEANVSDTAANLFTHFTVTRPAGVPRCQEWNYSHQSAEVRHCRSCQKGNERWSLWTRLSMSYRHMNRHNVDNFTK